MKRTDVINSTGGVDTIIDPSALMMRVRWDFTDRETAKWSRPKQLYRYRRLFVTREGTNVYPYEVITARERIRGSGTVFQFEFRTQPAKDCKLLGWAMTVTGGTNV